LLLALPPIDLYLLVRLRHVVGGWTVLLAVLLSALAGSLIARSAGLRELRDWQAALAQGRAPEHGVLEGLLLLLGCFWLIVPGPLSDVLGLLLLLPALRRWLSARLMERFRSAIERGTVQFGMHDPRTAAPPPHAQWTQPTQGVPNGVIDVEGETVESSETDPVRKRLSS
ncbi:MAG: FxsA family protein, partial [Polyangiales bacterium]